MVCGAGLKNRSLLKRGTSGSVQVLPVFIDDQYRPEGALRQTLRMIECAHVLAEGNADQVALCRNGADTEAAHAEERIALILALESAPGVDASVELFSTLFRLGVRIASIAHWGRTPFAEGSREDATGSRLTAPGIRALREMERLGMLYRHRSRRRIGAPLRNSPARCHERTNSARPSLPSVAFIPPGGAPVHADHPSHPAPVHATGGLDAMLSDLEELVSCESYSADHAAVARSAQVVAEQGSRLLGAQPRTFVTSGVTHLQWSFGAPRILLLGHHDTVWPMGSLKTHPWSVQQGIARGPGVFDMKAGLVQMFHALASLPSLDGVCVLVTGDEEVGSTTSRAIIEESARNCAAALVLEASATGGALKTSRKGVSAYDITVHGRAAHSGLEPEKGINAAVEAAHQILALQHIADTVTTRTGTGTTVTPTLLSAGTAGNTVPPSAELSVDVRVPNAPAQTAVDDLIRTLQPQLTGARIDITGGPNRPPLDADASRNLFALAGQLATELGMDPLRQAAVGGASDGNYTAGVGCPTLDGLGAVGDGAHADHEHVVTAHMPERTRLLAHLVGAMQ